MANVDAAELKQFNAQSQSWWDENGPFKALHDINPLRLEFMRDQTEFENKTVIDIGCGGGILTEAMSQLGAKVTGIDLAIDVLDVAKQHAKANKLEINYQKISAEEFAEKNAGKFDIVTCMEMLEHVPDPLSIVQACAKLVKPGGWVFLSTLNRNPKSFLFAIVGAEYVMRMIPKGTHQYSKFIKPAELTKWCRHADLVAKKMQGINYQALSKHYYLSDDVSVNYLLALQK